MGVEGQGKRWGRGMRKEERGKRRVAKGKERGQGWGGERRRKWYTHSIWQACTPLDVKLFQL